MNAKPIGHKLRPLYPGGLPSRVRYPGLRGAGWLHGDTETFGVICELSRDCPQDRIAVSRKLIGWRVCRGGHQFLRPG